MESNLLLITKLLQNSNIAWNLLRRRNICQQKGHFIQIYIILRNSPRSRVAFINITTNIDQP